MKKYLSDKSNARIFVVEATTLKISRDSPLRRAFPDGEIHLSPEEAEGFATWLGKAQPAISDTQAAGTTKAKATAKPKAAPKPQPNP